MTKNNLFTLFLYEWLKVRFALFIFVLLLSIGAPCSAQSVQREEKESGSRFISGDLLRKMHPTNLWEAIKMIEPAIRETDENSYGSDPNNVPVSVEIRGAKRWGLNELTSSALPVFILNGAIVDAPRIYDLNIHDVESVCIRKDARELAGSGLRGGNGIIEIKTIRPEAGTIRLSYRFDGGIEWADLNSYHLMNAGEKLALEKKANLYDAENRQQLLKEREQIVAGGVNKEWLKLPLTTALQHRHRLDISGGDEFVRYQMGLRISPGTQGVMKGSKRDFYGVDAYIEYRYRTLTLSNRLSIDKMYANASPYGTFDLYPTINPYYTPEDDKGIRYSLLGEATFNQQLNPEYESALKSFRKTEAYGIWNNFRASLELSDKFQVEGHFSFVRDHAQEDYYISPASGLYSGLDQDEATQAGKYDINHRNTTTYEGNLSLRYDDRYKRSRFGGRLSMHIFQGKTERDYYGGTGIPTDRMGFISFTTTYDQHLSPDAIRQHDRMLSGIFSGYYNYDKRYEGNINLRVDKSSRLAIDRQLACFYGLDLRWHIHNESFMKEQDFLNRLTLETGWGTTGSIDFVEEDHLVKYGYNIGNEYIYDYYLIGASIKSLPNPKLKPRTTYHKNIRLTAVTRWFSLELNYFNDATKNLLILHPEALATGYDNIPANGGEIRNSGLEYCLHFPLFSTADNFSLRIYTNGIHRKNRIKSIPDYFRTNYNKNIFKNLDGFLAAGIRPSLLEKGQAVDAIYAALSIGMDAYGNELFQHDSGASVSIWEAAIMKKIGNPTPKLKGSLGLQANWQQWSLQAQLNYSLGGEIYNETLHQIQHADPAYNGEKRMSDANIRTNNAKQILATSRFVETNNEFSLGNLRIGYSFQTELIRNLRMKVLDISLTGNGLFHKSSADYQRGIRYPYARTLTLSLNAIF